MTYKDVIDEVPKVNLVEETPDADRWAELLGRFKFPFPPKPHQRDTLNSFGHMDRHGYWWKPGTGKTFGTAAHALYIAHKGKTKQWIVLMPPIVLRNWSRFLEKIIDKTTGKPVTQLLYAGTPAQRKAMKLDATFILMSYEIFKKDFQRFEDHFWDTRVGLIADEAHKLKNMQSQTYKAIWRMFSARPALLASGTPISTPEDAYTYMKFTFPGRYRNKREFEQLHVLERDDYEKVTRWQNFEYLKEGFAVNSTQYTAADVRSDSDPVNFIPIVYDLAPAHLKLYNELVTQQMLEMDDGTVIDALTASALYHRCQQIVLNWGIFSDDPSKVANGFDLVDEVLDEIGDEKLVIVANYRMTTLALADHLQKHLPALIIGGLSEKQRYERIDRFVQDPRCRVAIIQPEAGGVGLDGLQAVCNEALFLECPTIPRQFEQAYARLDREGQTKQVNCRIAVANQTIQVRLHKNLLERDDTIRKVTGSLQSLREAIHGN